MTHPTDTAFRPRSGAGASTIDRTDRILLGACVLVWLAALGAAVAATVALVDLTSGQRASTADSGTPWLLYTVIGVSAAVIVAAVPLLLRARRAQWEVASRPQQPAPRVEAGPPVPSRGVDAPTEKLRVAPVAAAVPEVSGPLPRAVSPAVDRLWLRGATSIVTAIGASTLLVSVATYLMAVGNDTAAWVFHGLAGVLTVGMAAIPWYFLRELHTEARA